MRLREAGQRPEWARLVLPNAVAVRFVVQMNARGFFTNFVPLRCSASAQAEIRRLLGDVRHRVEALAHVSEIGLGSADSARDLCTKAKGEDCRLYAIGDAEKLFGPLPDKPWEGTSIPGL